jgi:hypothetical protein
MVPSSAPFQSWLQDFLSNHLLQCWRLRIQKVSR